MMDGPNLYSYTKGAPTISVDKNGGWVIFIIGGIAIGAGIICALNGGCGDWGDWGTGTVSPGGGLFPVDPASAATVPDRVLRPIFDEIRETEECLYDIGVVGEDNDPPMYVL